MASIRGERRDEPPGPHFLRHSLERRRLRPQGVPSRGAQRCIADPGDVGPLQHGAVLQGAAARIPHSPAAGHAPPAVVGPPLWSQAGADTARAARRCPASRAAGSRMVPEGRCRRPSHPTRQGTRGADATRDAAPMVAPMAGGGSRSACRGGAPAKPPLDLWIIASVVRVFGASEAGLHALTLVSALVTLAAVYWAGSRIFGQRRAAFATLLAVIALGLPVLDAELALPESLLIAPVSWAGAIVAVRLAGNREQRASRRFAWWPLIAGVLVAAGIAIQQTVLAELLAFALALAISPRVRLRDCALFVSTVIVFTLAWLGPVIAMAGAGKVAFALVGFYIPFTQSVLPTSAGGQLWHFAEAFIAGALIVGGAFLRRTAARPTWFFVLWAGAALLVPGAAGQPYAHYLIPAVAPVALTIAGLRLPLLRRSLSASLRATARLAPQLTGLIIAAVMGSVAGLDWVTPAAASPLSNSSRNLNDYYGGALATALQQQPRADWDARFDSRVPADEAVATWIQNEKLGDATAVVWSSDAWVYALADLTVEVPTPPIYNDEVLLGINGQVAAYVASLQPDVIVTSTDAVQEFPEIQSVLKTGYVAMFFTDPDTVWVRADVASQLP
ncbi:MAG: hypothetical protein E6I55_03390 [Chloroflexi bacterium]|nr:MAG: hypothetical protein E6I55_03390 [Chloroflexota bacterium]